MKSIIQKDGSRCFFCGGMQGLEEHHIFGGAANRKLSEKYGLKITCCKKHHTDPKEGVQYNREMNQSTKRLAQIAFEGRWTHDLWMETFKKNYL